MKMWQILKLIFGVILYALELGLNLNTFLKHTRECCSSVLWVLLILVCATFLVNIVTITNRRGEFSFCWYGAAFILQLCVVVRYFEEWKMLKNDIENDNKSRKLLRVRFTQALFNSGPQCILHGYIMVETWNFPPYAIASLAVSFISLVWGFYSFSPSHPEVSTFGASILVMGKLGFIISRLVLLTFFAYFFGPFFSLLFGPRILVAQFSVYILAVYLLCCYIFVEFFNCCGDVKTMTFFVWNCFITTLTSTFDVTTCFHGYGRIAILHFVENCVMFCVEMWIEPYSDSDHIDTIRFLTLTVALGGFGVGWVFSGLAYCCFMDHVDRDAPSLCFKHPPEDELTHTTHTSTPSYAPASTSAPKDPSPPDTAAFVVKKQHVIVQGPTPPDTAAFIVKKQHVIVQGPGHAAVLERTQVCGTERC